MTRPGICLFILFLVELAIAETETNPVSVEIRQVPIVFGETAILFCNLSEVSGCCSNTVTWMRNYEIIVHHGVSVNAQKYKQIQSMEGFSLLIMQFEHTDMRVKYSCLYKFMSASIYLEMDENKYEKHPKDKAASRIEEWNNKKQRIYAINLVFEEVYPMPTCRILSDGYEFKTESHSLKNGIFNNASVHINVSYTERNCGQIITGVCSVGKFNMTWNSRTPLNCYGEYAHIVASDRFQTSVIISSTVIIIIILTAVVYNKKCKTKKRDNREDEPLLGNSNGQGRQDRYRWFPKSSNKNFGKLVQENVKDARDQVLAENNTEIYQRRVHFYHLGKYRENIGFHTFPPRGVKRYCKDNNDQ